MTASVRPIHGIAVNIIINGLGVAGPALAYWLTKSGHDVLLVEQTQCRRVGGYVVDFWGIGYDIVEKMGLIAEIRHLGYQVREVRFVDRHGLKRGGFDVDVFGSHDQRSLHQRAPL